jgi:hypothetical protein
VSDTLAPLQGTTQRLGRVVDRFGNRKGAKGEVATAGVVDEPGPEE